MVAVPGAVHVAAAVVMFGVAVAELTVTELFVSVEIHAPPGLSTCKLIG